jgi:hypothetical protein
VTAKCGVVDKYTLPIGNSSNQTIEFGTKRERQQSEFQNND